MLRKIQKFIYRRIKKFRFKVVLNVLDKNSKSVLDIGCQDLKMYNLLKEHGYEVTLVDYEPKYKIIRKEDIQQLSFADNSFDIVVCQEVLEHIPNPVKAMKELQRVARKQVVITVPYEPFFTLFRFLHWEEEHLWTITPLALKTHMGKPHFQKKIFFSRYYMGVWKKN